MARHPQDAQREPPRQKVPLLTSGLRKALTALPDTLPAKCDRALLLVGFAAALRRSELVTLEVRPRDGAFGWIVNTAEGLFETLMRDSGTRRVDLGDASITDLVQERSAVPDW